MKKWTIYWMHGEKSTMEGETIEQAFTNAGYGGGAIQAVDFYAEGENDDWEFVSHGNWKQKV